MNYKPLLVVLIFGLFYTNAQQKSEISFKEVKHKYGCRNCYGSLVVKKGNFSDTIYGGQWGNTVNYKLVKIDKKDYIHTSYNYGFAMGESYMIHKILSLDEDIFLESVFEKEIKIYQETHRKYNGIPTNFIFERDVQVSIKNGIEFDIKLVVSYCPEVEDESCDQLFEESYIEFFKIN